MPKRTIDKTKMEKGTNMQCKIMDRLVRDERGQGTTEYAILVGVHDSE